MKMKNSRADYSHYEIPELEETEFVFSPSRDSKMPMTVGTLAIRFHLPWTLATRFRCLMREIASPLIAAGSPDAVRR